MPSRPLMIAALLILPTTAFADARYEMEVKDLQRGDITQNEILSRDGKLRMAVRDGGVDGETEVIFLPDADEMVAVDHRNKEVRRMTSEDLQRMQGMMAGAMQQMRETLKNMPPEARAQAEKMMKGQGMPGMGGAPVEKVTRATGRSEDVAGIECDVYELLEDGEKTQELCVADPDEVDGGDELLDSLSGMAKFMEGFVEAMGGAAPDMGLQPVDGGLPILSRDFEDGRPVREARLVSAEEVSLDDEQFQAPKGYRERKMME